MPGAPSTGKKEARREVACPRLRQGASQTSPPGLLTVSPLWLYTLVLRDLQRHRSTHTCSAHRCDTHVLIATQRNTLRLPLKTPTSSSTSLPHPVPAELLRHLVAVAITVDLENFLEMEKVQSLKYHPPPPDPLSIKVPGNSFHAAP